MLLSRQKTVLISSVLQKLIEALKDSHTATLQYILSATDLSIPSHTYGYHFSSLFFFLLLFSFLHL